MDTKIKLAKDFLLALNTQEHERMFSYLSEDVKIVGASGTHYGKPELRKYFSHSGQAYKDSKQETIGEYSMDNVVIIETILRAEHVGPYMGIPASNKRFEMPTLHVFEVKDGKITAWREYQNQKIVADLHNR